jgi:hypothetical protein
LIDGMGATDHEAQTNFQKKTQDRKISACTAPVAHTTTRAISSRAISY